MKIKEILLGNVKVTPILTTNYNGEEWEEKIKSIDIIANHCGYKEECYEIKKGTYEKLLINLPDVKYNCKFSYVANAEIFEYVFNHHQVKLLLKELEKLKEKQWE